MEQIRIRSCFSQDVTIISNDFLDRFLPEANGDFLKIYLCLLRSASKGDRSLSLCKIADRLNCTENDVHRALRYWEKEGVLALTFDADETTLTDIAFTSFCSRDSEQAQTPVIEKASDISRERLLELGERNDIRELFFIAQQYFGRALKRTEMQSIVYLYDVLHLSADLIDYLIDYCVSGGHPSFRYIEKVAQNWKDSGISTVHDARKAVGSYHKEYYDILKALGINNHHPVEAETKLMCKWIEKYRFPMEIITEACTRTVMNASKPTLSYTDGILSKWNSRGVKTLDDIRTLDEEHSKAAAPASKDQAAASTGPARSKNGFTDFQQRTYDYNSLESKLLKLN